MNADFSFIFSFSLTTAVFSKFSSYLCGVIERSLRELKCFSFESKSYLYFDAHNLNLYSFQTGALIFFNEFFTFPHKTSCFLSLYLCIIYSPYVDFSQFVCFSLFNTNKQILTTFWFSFSWKTWALQIFFQLNGRLNELSGIKKYNK